MPGIAAPFPFCANRVRKTVPQAAEKRLILQLTIQPLGTMFVKRLFLRLAVGAALLLSFSSPCFGEEAYPSFRLPEEVAGVDRPVISLDGEWRFKRTPDSRWARIRVPGEAAMQGYAIRHDVPFLYRRVFAVPADFAGKRIILRFDGVYSHARLSVNGRYVREHHGGFTRWETDVTRWVRPGRRNELLLEVTDRLDEPSYASGYAHHPVGGILRGVTLFALPQSYVCDGYVETELDSICRDATLRVGFVYSGQEEAEAELRLTDPWGRAVPLRSARFGLRPGANVLAVPVSAPAKWDAEHPRLYTLSLTLRQGGRAQATFRREVGFREVRVEGDRLLVNGRPVKLRGACRHDMHPRLGRTTTARLDSLDVRLFKEANMNFVRTSHYPPSEAFLDWCDRYGLYVECETAVCFVNTYRQKNYAPGSSENDTAFTERYLGQCREMVKAYRAHPSILFWSLGNESVYGSNIKKCNEWVRATDRTRPVIYSYPGTVPEADHVYDILSMHYPGVDGTLWQYGKHTQGFQGEGIPALFDEWAHPACYTYATLRTDPNIREFWGQSLDLMWSRLFDARGGLGGAIWGYVDETFAVPEPEEGEPFWKEFAHTAKPEGFRGNCVGYGEWGIVDVWRRRKPEFWATKKAYSPVRLETPHAVGFTSGQPLRFPVRNRFDHTNLDEISATYSYAGRTGSAVLTPAPPHGRGLLTIPAHAWVAGDTLRIDFRAADGSLVDTYRLWLGRRPQACPVQAAGSELDVAENDTALTASGEGFTVVFDKRTGLIARATTNGCDLLAGGPFLNAYVNLNHLSGAEVRKTANYYAVSPADWRKETFRLKRRDGGVQVRLSGTYKSVRAEFDITLTPQGRLSVSYVAEGLPNGYLRESGLSFRLPRSFDSLAWQRAGYWDCYPADAMSGNEGTVPLYRADQPAYGDRPAGPWALDTRNYYYWSDAGAPCSLPLTQAAKAMKENVYIYTLSLAGGTEEAGSLSVVSPGGDAACRLEQDASGGLTLHADNRWDYPEIAWGNYCKLLEALPCYGRIDLQLSPAAYDGSE